MTVKQRLAQDILSTLRAIDGEMDRFDELAAARLNINATDFRCLDVLSRGSPMTAGEIAREAGLTTGAVTALLDRLESSGYVARSRDSQDRRRVIVAPTKRAIEKVWPIFAGVVSRSTALLQRFSEAELQSIKRFLEENHNIVRAEIERLSTTTRTPKR